MPPTSEVMSMKIELPGLLPTSAVFTSPVQPFHRGVRVLFGSRRVNKAVVVEIQVVELDRYELLHLLSLRFRRNAFPEQVDRIEFNPVRADESGKRAVRVKLDDALVRTSANNVNPFGEINGDFDRCILETGTDQS